MEGMKLSLQYIEYGDELRKFYNRSKDFGHGRCVEIHGLPGVGLKRFVESYIDRYGEELRQRNIYCCVIQCPKKGPENLFLFIIRKLNALFCRELKERALTELQWAELRSITEYSNKLSDMIQKEDFSYCLFAEYVLEIFEACRKFRNVINVRLFVTDFDRVRKLFSREIDYALLFKEMCEGHTDWLGVAITTHRTLAVIAMIVETFSDFASLFCPISLNGFNKQQLGKALSQLEQEFDLILTKEARDKLWYYCGNNPHRLNLLFTALSDLREDLIQEQWNQMTSEELIEQAYRFCSRQMDEQLMSIVLSVNDIRGNGIKALERALFSPFSNTYNEAREYLFHMQILESKDTDSCGKMTMATIPILKEVVERMSLTSEKKEQNGLRILQLSDLHFGSDSSETDGELRKNYISGFFQQMRKLCREKQVDYITGDIGWKAQESDYAEAEKFIQRLMETCGLSVDKLFLCPGNHDVKRKVIEDLHYPENQKEADRFFDLQKLDKHAEAFDSYISLCRHLGCHPYQIGKYTSYLTGFLPCKDFVIMCLNTAWLAQDKNKSTKVWVGKNYIVTIKNSMEEYYSNMPENRKLPVITLMHHPERSWEEQECSNYSETINAWGMVSNMSDVIFCGHTHEMSDVENIVNSSQIYRGGAFYENYVYQNSFCVYTIKDKKCSKEQYIHINGKWMKDSN